MTEPKFYPLNQSPFYKIRSIRRLAAILNTDQKTIVYLLSSCDDYIKFPNKQGRDIQWPKPNLRGIQNRASILLGRIETPEILHSAKRVKSYITNAAAHSAMLPAVKVDIVTFFQKVRFPAVFHFFRDKMLCEPDVAAVLAKLLTIDRHLPTGGNASPILSYFAYMDMFAEIDDLARIRGCKMTCLFDDMAFTGSGATPKLLHEVQAIMRRYRLRAHKTKVFKARQARVMTGVAVTVQGLRLPNKRQRAIAQDMKLLSKQQSDQARAVLLRRAIGRLSEAAQIDPRWAPRAKALVAKQNAMLNPHST
jgi:RNA-directed DNA polymerase